MDIDDNRYITRLGEEALTNALHNRKVLFVVGPRQVGKTTLLQRSLAKKGAVFLNMDVGIDRERLAAAAALSPIDALRQLGVGKILVIDEAHRFPDIGRLVKGWYDAGVAAKIILLGSSSIGLLDTAAAELTGRNEKMWLTPLLFAEVLAAQTWFIPSQSAVFWQEHFKAQIQALLTQRLIFGSYPEAYLTASPGDYVRNLVDDYLLKDIWQASLVRNPEVVRKLLLLLAHQVGSEVSVAEIGQQLGASWVTVDRYLALLEQSFVIFRLPAWSTNPRVEVSKNKKVYFWDTGVRNALLNEFGAPGSRSDTGPLWENWVIAELMKRNLTERWHADLFFWRRRTGGEVDLIMKRDSVLTAYEMKWRPGRPATQSFTHMYHLPVQVVTPENVVTVVLGGSDLPIPA